MFLPLSLYMFILLFFSHFLSYIVLHSHCFHHLLKMQTDSQKLKFFTIFNHRTFFTIFTNFNAKIINKDITGKWVWSSVSQMLLNCSPGTKIFDLETEWRFFIVVTGNLSLFPHHRAGVSMRWKLRLPFLLIYKEMQLSWRQTTGET